MMPFFFFFPISTQSLPLPQAEQCTLRPNTMLAIAATCRAAARMLQQQSCHCVGSRKPVTAHGFYNELGGGKNHLHNGPEAALISKPAVAKRGLTR